MLKTAESKSGLNLLTQNSKRSLFRNLQVDITSELYLLSIITIKDHLHRLRDIE